MTSLSLVGLLREPQAACKAGLACAPCLWPAPPLAHPRSRHSPRAGGTVAVSTGLSVPAGCREREPPAFWRTHPQVLDSGPHEVGVAAARPLLRAGPRGQRVAGSEWEPAVQVTLWLLTLRFVSSALHF